MMKRFYTTMAFLLASFVAIAVLPFVLEAQEGKQLTDFRDRAYTEKDLADALFPEAEPQVRTRGIKAQDQQIPKPTAKPSAALSVFFEFNSAVIRPEYHTDLDKLGHVLTQSQYAEKRLEIEGHTDGIGSDAYNRRLSEQRAKSVRQYLVERFAIDESRLMVRGYGKVQPIATNDTPEGRSKNRRIEVVNPGQ